MFPSYVSKLNNLKFWFDGFKYFLAEFSASRLYCFFIWYWWYFNSTSGHISLWETEQIISYWTFFYSSWYWNYHLFITSFSRRGKAFIFSHGLNPTITIRSDERSWWFGWHVKFKIVTEYTTESSRTFSESIRSFDWNWTILKLKVYDNFADDLFKYTASQKIEISEDRIFETNDRYLYTNDRIPSATIVNSQIKDRLL